MNIISPLLLLLSSIFLLSGYYLFFPIIYLFALFGTPYINKNKYTLGTIPYFYTAIVLTVISIIVFIAPLPLSLLFISICIYIFFLYFKIPKRNITLETPHVSYKKHVCIVLIIVVIAFLLRSWAVGSYSLRDDEFITAEVVAGQLYAHNYYKWDWNDGISGKDTVCALQDIYCNYTRAWIYTKILAFITSIIGITEFGLRLAGVITGGILMPIMVYAFLWHITRNIIFASTAAIFIAFHPFLISLDRFARMYTLLIPIVFMASSLFFLAIEKQWTWILDKKNKILKSVYEILPFHFLYAIGGFIFLYIAYLLHLNALIILPAIFVYLILEYILTHHNKYRNIVWIGCSIIAIAIILKWIFHIGIDYTFFFREEAGEKYNLYIRYWNTITTYPFGQSIAYILVFLYIFLYRVLPIKTIFKKYINFCLSITIFSGAMYVFVLDTRFFIEEKYIAHIIPFSIIALIGICYALIEHLYTQKNKWLVAGSIIAIILFVSLINNKNAIYLHASETYPKMQQAYDILIKNANPKEEVVLGKAYRSFYAPKLHMKQIIEIPSYKTYTVDNLKEDIQMYKKGWIIFSTFKKSLHINEEVYNYMQIHLLKLSGVGINNLEVELYYFNVE